MHNDLNSNVPQILMKNAHYIRTCKENVLYPVSYMTITILMLEFLNTNSDTSY